MFGVDKEGNDILTPQFRASQKPDVLTSRPGSLLDLKEAVHIEFLRLKTYQKRHFLKQALLALVHDQSLPTPSSEMLETARRILVQAKINSLHRMESQRQQIIDYPANPIGTQGDLFSMNAVDQHFLDFEEKKISNSIPLNSPEVLKEAVLLAYEQGEYKAMEPWIDDTTLRLILQSASGNVEKDVDVRATRASANAILSLR